MPCRSEGAAEEMLRDKLDEATRLLCEQCQRISLHGCGCVTMTAETKEWYQRHVETDIDRAKRTGLQKLTLEERRALGLSDERM